MEKILDSKHEWTLIIPDIHDKVLIVDQIVKREKPTRVVSLGDWFDSWTGSAADATITAEYLKSETKDWDLVLGNHDLSYGWHAYCSGWTQEKAVRINAIMKDQNWARFFPYTWVGPYLCTHAGVHRHWWKDEQDFMNQMRDLEVQLRDRSVLPPRSPWLGAGFERGGDQRYGGIVWCDWTKLEPPDGVKQICGHTPAKEVRYKNREDVICLDTALHHYAVWDGKDLNVRRVNENVVT